MKTMKLAMYVVNTGKDYKPEFLYKCYAIEVIGNIHEHSGLLEKKDG